MADLEIDFASLTPTEVAAYFEAKTDLLLKAIAKLTQRVELLEQRADMPVRDGHPLWQPTSGTCPRCDHLRPCRHDEGWTDARFVRS